MQKLRVGLSPCPNDTFVFHGLLCGATRAPGLELALELHDIQELNQRLARGALDAGKASFFAALDLSERFGVLPVGAAIGFGVGPLLVAAKPSPPPDESSRVLCPGEATTATLLLRSFFPRVRRVEHVVFSEIMEAVRRGDADYGVVIHEGRFTYERRGLHLVEDLGTRWQERERSPLPLGGVLARLDLGGDVHRRLTAAIGASLARAREHPSEALETMRRHARELDDSVIARHVETYVNDFTRDLGARGSQALAAFEKLARSQGFVRAGAPPLRVLES